MGSDLRQKFLKPALRAGARSAALFWARQLFYNKKFPWLNYVGFLARLKLSEHLTGMWVGVSGRAGGWEQAFGRLGMGCREAGSVSGQCG